MATAQHYVWASGHFLLLVCSLRYFLAWVTFKSVSDWWYKASFLGAIISYAIVCHKSLGTPQPNMAYFRRAALDENVQYFLMAFFWWTSKPVALALLPYAIFSLFHALTFARTTLIPHFLGHGPPSSANGAPQPHPFAKRVQTWVKAKYDYAMRAVAYIELIVLGRVVLGAFLLQNSLLSPIIFAHFLRQRYYQSMFTRDALLDTSRRIDGITQKPGVPPVVGHVWTRVKDMVSRWGGTSLQSTDAPRRD